MVLTDQKPRWESSSNLSLLNSSSPKSEAGLRSMVNIGTLSYTAPEALLPTPWATVGLLTLACRCTCARVQTWQLMHGLAHSPSFVCCSWSRRECHRFSGVESSTEEVPLSKPCVIAFLLGETGLRIETSSSLDLYELFIFAEATPDCPSLCRWQELCQFMYLACTMDEFMQLMKLQGS